MEIRCNNSHDGFLSNNSTNGSIEGTSRSNPEVPMYLLIMTTGFYVFTFVAGVLGNALVIVVVSRDKELKNPTNYFLTNLSIADLLVILVCMPPALMEIYTKEAWYLGEAACKANAFIENGLTSASVLTILAISLERFYAICRPLRAQYMGTFKRTLKFMTVIWVVAFSSAVPFMWIALYKDSEWLDGTPIKVCRQYMLHPWKRTYAVGVTALFYILPLMILLTVYLFISKHLVAKGDFPGDNFVSPQTLRARRQVAMMLMTVCALFFICHLPLRCLSLILIFRSKVLADLGFEGYYNVIYMARVMFYLNSAVNPIVYNIMSTNFRNAFRNVLFLRQRRHLNCRETATTVFTKPNGYVRYESFNKDNNPPKVAQQEPFNMDKQQPRKQPRRLVYRWSSSDGSSEGRGDDARNHNVKKPNIIVTTI
ncbi:growth hormone secretagogue receptor type 1-like [Lineus longissimus]|uniref:growth hormone secretagogue receptor type 1-like n=1 Tax=Lineus longissimus TaxID=88925 RepID=UPI00315D22D2